MPVIVPKVGERQQVREKGVQREATEVPKEEKEEQEEEKGTEERDRKEVAGHVVVRTTTRIVRGTKAKVEKEVCLPTP